MKAIVFDRPGSAEVLKLVDIEKPNVHDDEVLIRVMAAGINRPDLLQRQGSYPPPPGASDILGLEVAGIIEETGERVCALLEGGGYAEYARAWREQCLPIPDDLSFEEAGALPECVFTVWKNVFVLGQFKAGQTALIHGGTSGIGTTAIQMIKAFDGHVTVTCGSDEKCAAAVEIGADKAINYKTQDFVDILRDNPVDIVLDMVGGGYIRRNLECLRTGGRHISIAFLNGAKADIVIPVVMQKHLILTGSVLRPRPAKEKAALAQEIMEKVWPKVESGLIRPRIHKVFDLEDAVAAHQMMEDGVHIGKIVLRVS